MTKEEKRERKRKAAFYKSLAVLIESVIIVILCIVLAVVSIKYADLKSGTDNKDTVQSEISTVSENSEMSSASTDSFLGSVSSDSGTVTSSNSSVTSSAVSSTSTSSDKASFDVNSWNLLLANPDHKLSDSFIKSVNKTTINSKYTSGAESSKYLDKRCVDYFNNMCKAAAADGVSLVAVSAYRTYNYQQTLYDNRVKRCINEGYSSAEAKTVAATIVALPGTSEHHTGLAVDINSVEETFENTKAFSWLQKHAAEYGFIMRYPKDKQNITKIIYEPWHYRFVGVEQAKQMNDLGLCLEEYIDYLKNKS